MSRRGWTLIAVLVVLCALIGGTLWMTRPKPAAAAADTRIQLLKADKEKLVKVELTGRPQGDLTLLKSGKDWALAPSGPAGLVFDTSNIDRLTTGISTLFADRVIDEKPTDLAQYGLKPPKAVATGTFLDGTKNTVYLGDKAPAGGTYYLQVKGDPRVYTVQMYDVEHFKWTMNDLRSKVIAPALNYDEVTSLRLRERNGTVIEAKEKTAEENKSYQLGFGKYFLTQPYPYPRGVDTEKQDQLIKGPQGIAIESIVADSPADLARYGLARPWGEALVRDKANAITFLFGAQKNDTETYFMIKGQPTVYSVTTSSLLFMDTKPFDIMDKFIFIPNIDDVDRMDITVGGVKHVLAITRTVQKAAKAGEEDKVTPAYSMDGKPAVEEYFKKFYQSVIGLQADGEVRRQVPDAPDIVVKFAMNKGPSKTVTVDYAPYDRDFYAIFMDGKSVFALTRGQMDSVRTKLDLLLKGQPVTD
jgi:Domain of unknown function (DUF4340)